MSSAIKSIGSIVLSLFPYRIPILNTCPLIYGWYGSVQFMLAIASVIELICLMAFVYDKAEEDDE